MNDDEVHFNTQSSTQWDGFRHFGILLLSQKTCARISDV